MNLNTQQNIDLCRKALVTKELQYYSKLCELYAELAIIQNGRLTSEELQSKYSLPLTMAARGDTEFTRPENNIINGRRLYSNQEIEIFRDYAFSAGRLRQFQEATNKLSGTLREDQNGEKYIDKHAMDNYHKFMQTTSKSTRYFDDFISEHSRQGIGHNFYLKTRQAIKRINEIDSQHLPIGKFIRDITPEAFGSTISRVNSHSQIKDQASSMYSRSETKEFREEPSLVKEAAHVIGKKAQKFFTKHKSQVRNVMISAACLATLLGGASYLNDRAAFQDLDVKTNAEQGYQNYVSPETINKLSAIRTAIENAENSPTQPSYDDLNSIRQGLDGVIDDVMSDLVTDAFESKNPDCKVTSVETNYDKTVNIYATNEFHPENFCTISYTDKNGEEKEITIHEFNSLAGNPIMQSYDNEYDLDKNSPSVNENDNFVKQGEDVMQTLAEYRKILEDTEHLAGTRMIYSGGFLFTDPSLKTILPEKAQILQEEKSESVETKTDDSKTQQVQEDSYDER